VLFAKEISKRAGAVIYIKLYSRALDHGHKRQSKVRERNSAKRKNGVSVNHG